MQCHQKVYLIYFSLKGIKFLFGKNYNFQVFLEENNKIFKIGKLKFFSYAGWFFCRVFPLFLILKKWHFQRRHIIDQHMWKNANVTNHQGNANQNHNEVNHLKYWQGCREAGTAYRCREMQMVQLPWKTACWFLKTLNKATTWPINPTCRNSFGRIEIRTCRQY